MAVDLLPDNFGNLYDPYNGLKDLLSKQLITPMDPDETFSDDPVRMMRAAYFSSKLNLKIDNDCYESMSRQAERIKIVSQERITTEFTKILSTEKPSVGLKILQEVGLMKHIFPERYTLCMGWNKRRNGSIKMFSFIPWKLLIMRQSYPKK